MEEIQTIITAIDRIKQIWKTVDLAQIPTEDLAELVNKMDAQVNELSAINLIMQMEWAKDHPQKKPEPTLAEREENTAQYLHGVDKRRQKRKRAKTEDPKYYKILCDLYGFEGETDTPLQAKQREYLKKARPDLFDRYQLGETEPNQTNIE